MELYQYRVIYGPPEGFCRAGISAQECPDYWTMTERAVHEKVWCSCCTQGLDNDMTALSFLNSCNCWNCLKLFQTSYFLLSKPCNLEAGFAGYQVWQQIWRVCSKGTGWVWSDVWDGARCSGIFKRSRSDRVVMFLVDGQNVLPQTWQQMRLHRAFERVSSLVAHGRCLSRQYFWSCAC